MKKNDETVKWIKDEISRIKNRASRDVYHVDGRSVSRMDAVSLRQIDLLEKQLEDYLKSKV